jgi:hypothetical protein
MASTFQTTEADAYTSKGMYNGRKDTSSLISSHYLGKTLNINGTIYFLLLENQLNFRNKLNC